jgi:hypothetical protein
VEDFKADERQDRLDLARKAIVCIRRALSTSGVDVATLKPGLPGDVVASIPAGTLAVSTDQWVSDLQNRTEVLTPSEKKKLMGILKSTGVVFKHGSGKTPSRTWVDTTGVMATSEGRRWWREAGEELGVKDPVEPGEDSQF